MSTQPEGPTDEGPEAKRAKLSPPLPPPPPPVPVGKGCRGANGGGMSALLAQLTARGVAKQPIGPCGQAMIYGGGLPLPGPPGCMGFAGGMPLPCGLPSALPLPAAPITAPPALPGRPVSLTAATAHITPVSSKPTPPTNQLAVDFVQATKERQAEMLKDPTVARAILQTLAEGSGGSAAAAVAASVVPGVAPAMEEAADKGTALWQGILTVARNGSKKLPAKVTLHHGNMQDIEVAVRTAAGNSSLLDIKHRVPFDEVARRVSDGSVLSLEPRVPMEQKNFDEYIAYFKSKARAGVARLDDGLALYIMPAGESPEVLKTLYELNTHIPGRGSLLGIIGTAGSTVAQVVSTQSEKKAQPAKAAAAPEKDDAKATEGEGPAENMSSKELMDLFSNPDLIKLLS